MQTFQRGQKFAWDSISPSPRLHSGLGMVAPGVTLDCSCFGVDASGKLSDERYFIFYNQKASPCGAVAMSVPSHGDAGGFDIDLAGIPAAIQRLVFVITIDGPGEMKHLQSGQWRLRDGGGRLLAEFPFRGADFGSETALIVGELYRKDGWRVSAVGQGFNGGLAALLHHFGGSESPPPASVPPPLPEIRSKPSLEKKLEKAAPHLLALAKPLKLSLEKRQLQAEVARVALVLDTSGSMYGQYKRGDVQTVVDRIFPLAVHFDDDGELDTWAFAEKEKALPPVTGGNVRDYINDGSGGWTKWRGKLGRGINNEPVVIRSIIERYRASRLPAYVIFISDGGVGSTREITSLMVEASKLPIFWQFVGIGGSNYGVLEKLDDMGGRTVDNCGFFALDDIHSISEQELYERLLNEFPQWLKEARAKNIIT